MFRSLVEEKSGVALILVIGILTVLLLVGLTMVNSMRIEEKVADDYFLKLGSLYFAKSGFDHAVLALKKDLEPAESPLFDENRDCWRAAFTLGNISEASVATFVAANPNLVTQVDANKYPGLYSRWIYVKRDSSGQIVIDDYNFSSGGTTARYGSGYEIIGRYAVLVTDEASKVNINVAGDLPMPTTPWSSAGPGKRGEIPFELRLAAPLYMAQTDGVNPADQITGPPPYGNNNAETLATHIVNARYGANDIATTSEAGESGTDSNANYPSLIHDGIDNDGDGTVDNYTSTTVNEGVNEPDEFSPDMPYPSSESRTGRDRPYRSICDLLTIQSFYDVSVLAIPKPTSAQAMWDSVAAYLTTDSKDYNQFLAPYHSYTYNASLLPVAAEGAWCNKICLNAIQSATRLYNAIDASDAQGFVNISDYNLVRRTCANICDFYDYDLFPTRISSATGTPGNPTFYGVESLRLNKVGLLSGYTRLGYENTAGINPTVVSGTWQRVGTTNMYQCMTPGIAAQCSYDLQLPSVGSTQVYTVYAHSGTNSTGLQCTFEGGAAVALAGGSEWNGQTVTVSADGLLNVVCTDTNPAANATTAIVDFFMVMSRYVEFINMSTRAIPIKNMRFTFDGGTTVWRVPNTETRSIPAADYSQTYDKRYGYLVLATNLYSFNSVWGDNTGSLNTYRTACQNSAPTSRVLILGNTNLVDNTTSVTVPQSNDWGVAPGSFATFPTNAKTGDIILYAPNNNAATTFAPCAWQYRCYTASQEKVGMYYSDSAGATPIVLSSALYTNYNREAVSAVSDASPWKLGTSPSTLGHQLGTPGKFNSNTATTALRTSNVGLDILWQCPSMPTANLAGLTNVTFASDCNSTLLYSTNGSDWSWQIDPTSIVTTDFLKYEAENCTSQTAGWSVTTPSPNIEPFETQVLRGTAANTVTWSTGTLQAGDPLLPAEALYSSLIIAGNYLVNPTFTYASGSRALNASNLYAADVDVNNPASPTDPVATGRSLAVTLSAGSSFDFDYVMACPSPYTWGKINVNTASLPALSALGFVLTPTDINNIYNVNNKPYRTIGELAGYWGYDPSAGTDVWHHILTGTDAQIRAKWGAISRYITVRSDVYEIQVVGQSIRDRSIGNDFDPANDHLDARYSVLGVVDRGDYRRDPSYGKIRVLQYRTQ